MHDMSSMPEEQSPAPAQESQPPEEMGTAPMPAETVPPAANPKPALTLSSRLLSLFLPFAVVLTLLLLLLYGGPLLLLRWRLVEAQAEAEAAYMKRRAELKAEAEAAEQQLQVLDQRAKLTALGFREVVRLVTPTVVNVSSFRTAAAATEEELTRRRILIYDPESEQHYLPAGVGSGLLIQPGYVLTNHHVVREAARLRITFASGQSVGVDPERVVSDPITDLAVIHLPADPPAGLREDYAKVATLANSDEVQRGDLVLALGSPLGLRSTVTQGIISAKGRLLNLLDMVELLQTDAPINPGNSGGPLFDLYGRVVGINVAIASETGGNQGIGFAIPSNTAREIVADLIARGKVERGFIGVALEDVPLKLAKKLGLTRRGGVMVSRVVPDFPADKAGLQSGDVICRYDGRELPLIDTLRYLRQRILETDIGREVPVEIYRNGERQQLTLQIGERPTRLP